MNIEISKMKYWKEMNYYDGLLYLSLLSIDGKDDWRMPKYDEKDCIGKFPNNGVPLWYNEDGERFETILNAHCYWIVPVRDV